MKTNQSNLLNLPNILSLTRLVGTPLLFLLVYLENPVFFLVWYIFLGFTDFLDGKLARAWNQVTDTGAHLDSVADVVYYLSTAWFLYALFPEYLAPNIGYLLFFLVIFAVTIGLSMLKFREVLFFHTHLSRLSGLLVFIVFISSFFIDSTYLIQFVIFLYTLAFFEFNLIYFLRGDVSPDTRSVIGKN